MSGQLEPFSEAPARPTHTRPAGAGNLHKNWPSKLAGEPDKQTDSWPARYLPGRRVGAPEHEHRDERGRGSIRLARSDGGRLRAEKTWAPAGSRTGAPTC